MNIIVTFEVKDLMKVASYYLDEIGEFSEVDRGDGWMLVRYNQDKEIQIELREVDQPRLSKIILDVENVMDVYRKIDQGGDMSGGIKKDHFSYNGQTFTILESPIGESFCSQDIDGNLIVFRSLYNAPS